MKLSTLTEPGKILRTDYRTFQFSCYLPFDQYKHHKKQGDLMTRVSKYLEARQSQPFQIEQDDYTVCIRFENLDDAKMFVLAFSDIIHTAGARFE